MSIEFLPALEKRLTEIAARRTGVNPNLTQIGDNVTEQSIAPVVVIDAKGLRIRYATGGVSGDSAHVSGDLIYRRDFNILAFFRMKFMLATASIRLFYGLSNQTAVTMLSSDNPAGNYFGLQYSSARGDANWQFIRKDGTTQGIFNTGIAVDVEVHNLYMNLLASAGKNKIIIQLDNNIPQSYTTNMPISTTELRFITGFQALAALAREFEFGRVHIEGDK